jgi:thymidylate kinase
LTEVDISSFGAIVGDDGLADTLIEVADDLDRYYSDPVLVKRAKKKLTQRYWEIDGRARWSYYHFKLRRLLQRYRIRQRAPLYVLTGVDGAGKSSLAREMKEVLNRPGGYSAKIIYMGPWGHYKLKWTSGELFSPGWSVDSKEWLTCMLGRGSGPKTSTIVALRIAFKMLLRKQLTETEQWQHESLRQHSRLFVTLRFARSVFSAARFATMIFVEMYYRYYLAYRYRRIGVTVIADRYIYDLMTGRMHEIIPQYRTLRSFLCSIFPRPTRGFFVTNDAATILSRKADLSQEMLPKHLRLYEDLAQKYGFEEVVSDRPARDIAYDIISRHLEEIANYSRL